MSEPAEKLPPAPPTLEEYEQWAYYERARHPKHHVIFHTPTQFCRWRVQTLFKKEPDTVAWIDEFQPGETFVDVGANIGLYSIWAAKTRAVKVFAFEPEALNFAELMRNIVANQAETVLAFPIALSDEARVAPLYLTMLEPGRSCHQFGQPVSFSGKPMNEKMRQGSVSARLDDLVAEGVVPKPDHIKVDVDGLEHLVVAGATHSLMRAKSALIEINSNQYEHRQVIERMEEEFGFTADMATADKARRTEGAFAGIGNVIFRR